MAENDKELGQREEKIKVARMNLANPYLLGLAASKVGTPENYGKLLEGVYEATVSKVPDENTYRDLFLPALLSSEEGITINAPYLKTSAAAIIQESLFTLPADEILNDIGVNEEVANKYFGKYLNDLSDEDKKAIVGTYFPNMVENVIARRLPEMRKARAGNLEKILTQES